MRFDCTVALCTLLSGNEDSDAICLLIYHVNTWFREFVFALQKGSEDISTVHKIEREEKLVKRMVFEIFCRPRGLTNNVEPPVGARGRQRRERAVNQLAK